MRILTKACRFANLLSLDVVAGAIVSALFFGRILHVLILPWGFAALGLTVWIIYTADHLLDARRLGGPASTERHRFHQKHFRLLLFVLMAVLLMDGVAISLLRKPVLTAGIALAGMVAIYLLFQGKLRSWKELCGAMLYCAGVGLPAFSLAHFPITLREELVIVQFGITVFCNLLLFSLFDVEEDRKDKHNSFATVKGEQKTRLLLKALFVLNGFLIGLQLFYFDHSAGVSIVMFAMNFVLFFIFMFPGFFEVNQYYRILGDGIFLVPIFILVG